MSRVIVTGGAGFIGGETVLKLLDAGHSVYAIDLAIPSELLLNSEAKWLTGDFSGEIALDSIALFNPDAIIHCAGTSLVGPSVSDPQQYYDNNFVKTKRLLDRLIQYKISARFIFSSSAATYGNPIMTPIQEVDPTEPISPYGQSKLITDWMLQSYHLAYGLDFVSFRYFNACGADSQGRHGQAPGATHIVARLLESIRDGQDFTMYGTDYDTEDGTCIRDYIHVEDLAMAHITAINPAIKSDIYNLGTNQGHSNLQVLQAVSAVLNRDIAYLHGTKRAGDPAQLVADPTRFMTASAWQPRFGLTDIIQHVWAWYNK
jgi:UDP-glucose 4-epimerase